MQQPSREGGNGTYRNMRRNLNDTWQIEAARDERQLLEASHLSASKLWDPTSDCGRGLAGISCKMHIV
jgi:hypothetical protein